MQRGGKWFIGVALLLLAGTVSAQEPEIVVGEIPFPAREWGEQKLAFEVTNNTEWLKYLVIETEVEFADSYVSPHRLRQTNFVVVPGANTIDPVMDIPPNYGQLSLWVRVYDVIDTLDDLSLGTKLFEQPFKVRFHTPEAVIPYFQERLSMPPMVGKYGMFDNEFSRLILVLLNEGKPLDEIAEMCNTSVEYAIRLSNELAASGYLKKEPGPGGEGRVITYIPRIPVIVAAYAVKGREVADRLATSLAAMIETNWAEREQLIDSMVAAKIFSGEKNNFFEGGTLLYHPYELVAGLYLWQVLGQKFITGSDPLIIFSDTDPCMPHIGEYTYLVQGGDYYNGHHYFSAASTAEGFKSHFGDSVPEVTCYPGFERKTRRQQDVDWVYEAEWRPESFLYDTTLVMPMLRLLERGVDDALREAMDELRELNREFLGSPSVATGTRYWFWNLTASLTLETLAKGSVITRTGNGQYRFVEKR